MRRVIEATGLAVVVFFALGATKLDPKLWLPKKKGVYRMKLGQTTKVTFVELDKGAQLLLKGPGIVVCEAKRTDERVARIDLELPGVIKDLVNLFVKGHDQTAFAVPEGLHTIEVGMFAPSGSVGWAKLQFQPVGFQPKELPSDDVAPVAAAPAAAVAPAVAQPPVKRSADFETGQAWSITPAAPMGIKVEGPRTLVFDIVRSSPEHTPGTPSRLILWRDGKAAASALFSEASDTFECAVPAGKHHIALRTNDPRGISAVLREVR